MSWIYLSPHFDDVALSCGGLVWQQVHSGIAVSIWTVCGGQPPEGPLSPFAEQLHARWGTGQNASERRRLEDLASCQRLGASQFIFSVPDCIYRDDPGTGEFMYASEEALNGSLQPGDEATIRNTDKEMEGLIGTEDVLVCPLGLGNHVDHQLTMRVAEGLQHPLWYYADFPYVLKNQAELEKLPLEGWKNQVFPITQQGLAAWQDSIAAHASQISTFWPGLDSMKCSVSEYLDREGGIRFWRKR